MNTRTDKHFSGERIARALTELGEDATAERIEQLQARIDVSALPADANDELVKTAVDATRRLLDTAPTSDSTTPDGGIGRRFSVEQIETRGVQAVGTFDGTPRQGWIMNAVDFVDYAGYAQLVIPVSSGVGVKREIWHPQSASTEDVQYHEQRKALEQNLAEPIWKRSREDFDANTIVVDVHRVEGGGFALGKALSSNETDARKQAETLLNEYRRRSPGKESLLMAQFERTLRSTNFTGDAVILSGSAVSGKHVLLNTMLTTPPDLLARAYESEISSAIARGDAVFVVGTGEDPRERLLVERTNSKTDRAEGASQPSVGRDKVGSVTGSFGTVSGSDRETMDYALQAYGFLINRNEQLSLRQFADRIAAAYDVSVPRNAEVVRVLKESANSPLEAIPSELAGPTLEDLTVSRRDGEVLEVSSWLTRGRCATVYKFSFSENYSVQPFLIGSYMQGITTGLILKAVKEFVQKEAMLENRKPGISVEAGAEGEHGGAAPNM